MTDSLEHEASLDVSDHYARLLLPLVDHPLSYEEAYRITLPRFQGIATAAEIKGIAGALERQSRDLALPADTPKPRKGSRMYD